MRADQLLVERGLAASRSQAQRLIAAGVRWLGPRGWQPVAKNGDELPAQAEIELFTKTANYPVGVYTLPKHLDEKVARLHLKKVGAMLTELTDEQAAYIGVPKQGPYKPDTYRY